MLHELDTGGVGCCGGGCGGTGRNMADREPSLSDRSKSLPGEAAASSGRGDAPSKPTGPLAAIASGMRQVARWLLPQNKSPT